MRKILNDYPKHEKVQLKIGEGRIFIKPTIVTTVLGSCVSVAFFCPAKTMGGIFHALMPEMPEGEKKMLVQNHFKYVDSSIQQIVRLFERKGIKTPYSIGGVLGFRGDKIGELILRMI